jgi:hypothetical protein
MQFANAESAFGPRATRAFSHTRLACGPSARHASRDRSAPGWLRVARPAAQQWAWGIGARSPRPSLALRACHHERSLTVTAPMHYILHSGTLRSSLLVQRSSCIPHLWFAERAKPRRLLLAADGRFPRDFRCLRSWQRAKVTCTFYPSETRAQPYSIQPRLRLEVGMKILAHWLRQRVDDGCEVISDR